MNENKTNINWYPGHMAKTKRLIKEKLNLIDIVFEVIDARIPYSSKIKDIDEIIKNKPKILILTKYDLCDKEQTNKWIKYYENNNYKVIPLNLNENIKVDNIIKTVSEMLEELDKKRNDKDLLKRKYRALVIGVPNAGKSTLINKLSGMKVANTGNMPGVTKEVNWIRIGKLELLDTPGILWPKLDDEKVAYNLASLTAIKEEILPIYEVVDYILNTLYKYYPNILKERYKIDSIEEDITYTLDEIGKNRGCLFKGGETDYDKVVQLIMNDIKKGLIKGITFDRIN